MVKRLYVGNLFWEVDEATLKEYFEKAGRVTSAIVILDRETSKSKGFGFVEMETEEEAKKAIEMFNSVEFKGRKLVVSEARPREERTRNGRTF